MTDETVNDDGASPADDIKQQSPGETATQDLVEKGTDADPHKVENLTKQDRDIDPDGGSD